MQVRIKPVLVFVVLVVWLIQPAWAEKINAIPQGYVTDLAQVITPATRQKIELLATELQQKTGAQLAVVTVNSFEGQTKEDYAADLYKHLGIGAKKDSRGVLILIAPKERQRVVPIASCGNETKRYAWAGSARNWYPQGESGPEGCTKRCASAAAIRRANIQLLAVGPCLRICS